MEIQEKITITLEECAELASTNIAQVRAWTKDFDFPSMRIGARGGKRLVHRQAYDEWLRKRCESRMGEMK